LIKIKVFGGEYKEIMVESHNIPLIDILARNGISIYAPCGGKGNCGKCIVFVRDEGEVLSCSYYPEKDIEIILPGEYEAKILVCQTDYLEDVPFSERVLLSGKNPVGIAVDIGTTTVVLYYLDLRTGSIKKISSFLNPQRIFGADLISRIKYCQENETGLQLLQSLIINEINRDIDKFIKSKHLHNNDVEKIFIAGNTTMLHLFLGEDPLSIAIAPFIPKFIESQIRKGSDCGLNINPGAAVVTLPCISAYVGADIVAGLSAIKSRFDNYLFLDIGTNGEMALVAGEKIFTCSAAAGPAFEGASLSCGMGAVTGAISFFKDPKNYSVVGNGVPTGICGSGIVDIVAYLLRKHILDETGFMKEDFIIERNIRVTQQDIREIQLAKSAIFSGIEILLREAGMTFREVDALFLAGGFGNYMNVESAIEIGLIPGEMKDRIFPVGNSAGIGTLQYLKSEQSEERINFILARSKYIELSNHDDFPTEFALNMNFPV
jgi:uncharacterized 2Fe-2S/4Fe-4S cluster protein (DUF4445 family)